MTSMRLYKYTLLPFSPLSSRIFTHNFGNIKRTYGSSRNISIIGFNDESEIDESGEKSGRTHKIPYQFNNQYLEYIIENERKYGVAGTGGMGGMGGIAGMSGMGGLEEQKGQQIHNKMGEKQYLDLIRHVLNDGEMIEGRNGNVLSTFGYQMQFDLRGYKIPLLTTKKMAWKTCIKELLWFLSGDTDNHILQSQGVYIWDGNSTREFLNSRGLYNNREGDLGAIYGFQWRNFGGDYFGCDLNKNMSIDKHGGGIDQIKYVIDALKLKNDERVERSERSERSENGLQKEGRYSRRLIVSAWNPQQLHLMALPPCHVLFQFHVNKKDELSCSLYQRSGDVGLGIPFNIASYSVLTILIAHHCGLKPGRFIHNLGDVHIYESHIKQLKEQLKREPYDMPSLQVLHKRENIEDYSIQDFKVNNYKYYPKIEMDMVA
jgi:thymidylate synthase